ncbi:unnamed protein product [Ceratitis capitata]|uniref:(Mediterranean fruit fly) hypothetical protein n=1 Tax=Ceratitis capitata TaxID=7213 RepID=A0A811V3D4_CERCA|nr:unnamed protein product [Ceratitis capitata]
MIFSTRYVSDHVTKARATNVKRKQKTDTDDLGTANATCRATCGRVRVQQQGSSRRQVSTDGNVASGTPHARCSSILGYSEHKKWERYKKEQEDKAELIKEINVEEATAKPMSQRGNARQRSNTGNQDKIALQ